MNRHTMAQATAEVTTGAKNRVRNRVTPGSWRAKSRASVSARTMLKGTSPAVNTRVLTSTLAKTGSCEKARSKFPSAIKVLAPVNRLRW